MEPTDNTDFTLSSSSTDKLRTAAKAIKIGALFALIYLGVTLLSGLYNSVQSLFMPYSNLHYVYDPSPQNMSWIVSSIVNIFDLAVNGLFIIPILGLFKFSSGVNRGLLANDSSALDSAFGGLKKAGKTAMLFFIIKLAFWLISSVVSTLGAGMGMYYNF
jgi:hypothetical protein